MRKRKQNTNTKKTNTNKTRKHRQNKNGKKKKIWVRLYRPSCRLTTIHRRHPTTAYHGTFCLLPLGPGPVRSSLCNLDAHADSSGAPILMPDLVRAPAQHRASASRNPDLKPSTRSGPVSSGYRYAPPYPAG